MPEGKTCRQSEREQARLRKNVNRRAIEEHRGKDSGPNGLKLSDRGWRSKAWNAGKPDGQPLFAGARG